MNQLLALMSMVVCLLPAAAAIKCYKCSPDPSKSETCVNPTNTTTCESFYDSCMAMSLTMKTPFGEFTSIAMDCGVKAGCSGSVAKASCKAANTTGWVTKCMLSCCQEDLCNNAAPTRPSPTSTGQRAVVHFGGILVTIVLSIQAWLKE